VPSTPVSPRNMDWTRPRVQFTGCPVRCRVSLHKEAGPCRLDPGRGMTTADIPVDPPTAPTCRDCWTIAAQRCASLARDGDNVWRGAPLLSIHERGWRTPGPGSVAVLDLQVTGILLRSRHPEGCRCGDESSRARLVDTPLLYAMVEAARSFWNRCPIVSRRRAGGVAILMEALDRDIQVKNEFSVLGLRNRGS
jgi:hypothetical protein